MPQALSESGAGNAYPFCADVIRFVQEIRTSLSERSCLAEVRLARANGRGAKRRADGLGLDPRVESGFPKSMPSGVTRGIMLKQKSWSELPIEPQLVLL
jgi:hypothetical protein